MANRLQRKSRPDVGLLTNIFADFYFFRSKVRKHNLFHENEGRDFNCVVSDGS